VTERACYNRANYTNFIGIIVNSSNRIFRFNTGFLINQPIGYTREIPIDLERHSFDPDLIVKKFNGCLALNRTQNGFRVQADFSAITSTECGRCLDNFDLNLHTIFEEIFTFENHPLSEDEYIIPEDGNVDFEPYIRDYLLLEIPINPLCKPDCRGLCAVCGQNLNIADCEHKPRDMELTTLGKSLHSALIDSDQRKSAPFEES